MKLNIETKNDAVRMLGLTPASIEMHMYRGLSLEEAIEKAVLCRNMRIWSERYPDELRTWRGIKRRTLCPSHGGYYEKGYGKLGICESWKGKFGFLNFMYDMGPMPDHEKTKGGISKWTVDRIDNSNGYSPKNCRWATMKQQTRNTSRNHWVTINGEKMVLIDALRKYKISSSAFCERIKKGWSEYDAITVPSRKSPVVINGEELSISDALKKFNMPQGTYTSRLRAGWDKIAAITTSQKIKRREEI